MNHTVIMLLHGIYAKNPFQSICNLSHSYSTNLKKHAHNYCDSECARGDSKRLKRTILSLKYRCDPMLHCMHESIECDFCFQLIPNKVYDDWSSIPIYGLIGEQCTKQTQNTCHFIDWTNSICCQMTHA